MKKLILLVCLCSLITGCSLMEKSETARWDAYREAQHASIVAKSLVVKQREETKREWLRTQVEVLENPLADSSAAAIFMAVRVAEMFSPEARAAEAFMNHQTEIPTGVLKETLQELRGFAPAVLTGWAVGQVFKKADE